MRKLVTIERIHHLKVDINRVSKDKMVDMD
jgi:hypothetical protein